jgi:signal peptidase II
MGSIQKYRLIDFIENNLALALIAVAVIVVERLVKFYIAQNLYVGESIPVLGRAVMITRTENLGAGFGLLAGYNWLFVGAACLVLVLVIYFYENIIYNRLLVFATAFILGGTVGNMMDRVFFGRVTDYIDFSFWPTFNLSDISLVVGIGLLFIYMYYWRKEGPDKGVRYVHY